MKWVVLVLGLFAGAIVYVSGVLTPSAVERPAVPQKSESRSSEEPERNPPPALQAHAIDPAGPTVDAPSIAEPGANGSVEAHTAESQTAERSGPGDGATASAWPSSDPDQGNDTWGKLLRGAPVHSGPSVSSQTLGYAAAGAEMQLLERSLGWARVRDPATSREGWIYEAHITVKERPSIYGDQQQTALDDDETETLEQQTPHFKAKKSGKNSSKKRWRKRLRFVFRR